MYKFEKINEDTYKLVTDTEEITFNRVIDIVKELQSVDMYTTYYVAEFLAERGETLENTKLRVERKENGKTIVDDSNLKALEEKARNSAYYDILNRVFRKTLGKDYIGTLQLLNISSTDVTGVQKFVEEFTNILVKGISDNTP